MNDREMILEFVIQDGKIDFDVKNGDGVLCHELAKLVTAEGPAIERPKKMDAVTADRQASRQ
jgi:hypothetical protein